MANPGNNFKEALIRTILSWNLEGLKVYSEVWVGSRFVGKKRKLDIVLSFKDSSLGIEAKTQQTSGTAYQKLAYAIDDSHKCPIPTLIVFSGEFIEQDVKAELVSSGIGIEMEWTPDDGFGFGIDILKQRIMIELGMNWLLEQEDKRIIKDNRLF